MAESKLTVGSWKWAAGVLLALSTACGDTHGSSEAAEADEAASGSADVVPAGVSTAGGDEPARAAAGAAGPGGLAAGAAALPADVAADADDAGSIESAPLPERAAGPMRFVALDAARTGIDFVHRFEPDEEHLHILGNAMAGGGVAIGDADADGRPDVYLTRPHGGGRLHRNLGDFRFEDATEAAGLADEAWGAGATFADVDGDADLDLYVCGYDAPNRLHVNRGDGTFDERAAAAGLAFTGSSVMMAFADYDRDGDLDGYLLTNRYDNRDLPTGAIPREGGRMVVPPEYRELYEVLVKPDGTEMMVRAGQADHLYRNEGDGTFVDVSLPAGIVGNHFGLAATWWDADADGWPDLYVSNDFYGPDRLYRNLGNGTFADVAAQALPHTPWYSMGADAADIDNDGRVDFMASDMAGTSHYKQKVAMGDMSDSGWFLEAAVPRQYMKNAVYLNTGTWRFMEVASLVGLSSTDWTWSVKFGDFDEDGRNDVFVSNGMTRDYFNSDIRNDIRTLGAREQNRFWADEAPRLDEVNFAFRNEGDLRFSEVQGEWGLDHRGVTFGAAVGDLDGDGDLDLVTNDFEEPAGVYRNEANGTHRVVVVLEGTRSNRSGVGALVRIETAAGPQVRELWRSRGFMGSDEPRLHFGLGEVDVIDELTVEWPSGAVQRFEDLAADRVYTIVEPATGATRREDEPTRPMFLGSLGPESTERPYDDFVRQPLLPNRLSRLGPGIAAADVERDGDLDYFLGGPAGQAGRLFVNVEGRRFEEDLRSQPWAAHADREDMTALFLDVDADGDEDLFVVSGGIECEPGEVLLRDRLYLGDGTGAFADAPAEALPDLRDSGGAACAADVDRDGDLDLFVGGRSIPGRYPLSPMSRLLRNDGGRFVDATDTWAPGLRETGLVTAAVWSDADDDGRLDLLLTEEWGPVELWQQREDGQLVDVTRDARLADRLGWWNGIAPGDVDNDGDVDYVVTNTGLNTKYHASPRVPALLYYGDYDGSGRMRLIEAEYEDETLFPVRGKSCSTRAMPFLGEKFGTFDEFARASLETIYTEECLDDAHRFEVTTLASGVLVNDGDARFDFLAFPRLAQVAPGFGAWVGDVDADGFPDVCLAQNFYGPQPETGHMDGGIGLLLAGRGDGTFEPVDATESGIVVGGDMAGVAPTDFDGDGRTDLLFALTNGPVHAFYNVTPPEARVLALTLRGPSGNPTAVGARATLHVDDGTARTGEIHAGAGYLTQGAPRVVFGLGAARAVRLEVRWPDGTHTEHAVPEQLALGGVFEVARD